MPGYMLLRDNIALRWLSATLHGLSLLSPFGFFQICPSIQAPRARHRELPRRNRLGAPDGTHRAGTALVLHGTLYPELPQDVLQGCVAGQRGMDVQATAGRQKEERRQAT